jgi:MFS family permease
MLLASIWFRRRLHESPLFRQIQQQGRTEVHPVRTLLAHPLHRRRLVLAVLGLTAGQAVIWYTAYFQAHAFVQGPLGVSSLHATGLAVVAIAASLPLTVIAGRWSDKVGRRRPIILGLVLGAVMCGPVFHGLQRLLQPVVVVAVMESNHPHCKRWTPPGRNAACDELRSALLARGLQVDWQPVHDNGAPVLRLRIGDQIMHSDDPADLHATISNLDAWLVDHHRGPPPDVTVCSGKWWWAAALLTALGGCAALVYGPLAAALAELFPTPVRYTGTSLSYHLGNGLFGGVLPVTSHLLVMLVGHPLAGLVYPVAVALLSAGLAWLWLPEGRDVDISR